MKNLSLYNVFQMSPKRLTQLSDPSGKVAQWHLWAILFWKLLTTLLVRAVDYPKTPLPPLKLPLCENNVKISPSSSMDSYGSVFR